MEKLRFHLEYPTIRSEARGTTTLGTESYKSLNYKRNRKVRKVLTRSKFEFDFRKVQSRCTSKDRTYLTQNQVNSKQKLLGKVAQRIEISLARSSWCGHKNYL